MKSRWRLMTAAVLLSFGTAMLLSGQPTPPPLARGARHVEEGDFEEAIDVLDAFVKQIKPQASRSKELTEAYLYLGVAYVGLGHERLAKARFLEALSHDKSAALAEDQSPKVLRLFKQALDELRGSRSESRSATGPLEPTGPGRVSDGMLQVAVRPWAEVIVDGVHVGLTPFPKLPARPGVHTVRLLHPGFEACDRQVDVRPGEIAKLVVDLWQDGVRRSP